MASAGMTSSSRIWGCSHFPLLHLQPRSSPLAIFSLKATLPQPARALEAPSLTWAGQCVPEIPVLFPHQHSWVVLAAPSFVQPLPNVPSTLRACPSPPQASAPRFMRLHYLKRSQSFSCQLFKIISLDLHNNPIRCRLLLYTEVLL